MSRLIIPEWARMEVPNGRRGFIDAIIPPAEDFLMLIDTEVITPGEKTFSLALRVTESYDFYVDWGDGSGAEHVTTSTPNPSHTYDTAGEYEVSIVGTFPRFYYNGSNVDRQKILEIKRWGDIEWSSFQNAFFGCSNMNITATDAPNLTNVTNFANAFRSCNNFLTTPDLSNWDTSNITDMSATFYGCTNFNGDITGWDTSSVTTMFAMLTGDQNINKDIGNWNVGNCENFREMFQGATAFNQDLSSWNTSSATTMEEMFRACTNYNQPMSSWDVSSVESFYGMFQAAKAFNQDISGWTTSSATTMGRMFYDADDFNQSINSWNVSNVVDFGEMFRFNGGFNQPLNSWNTSSAQSFNRMFQSASSFNQDVSSWDISLVTNMVDMFNSSAFGSTNYDLLLVAWEGKTHQNTVTFHAGTAQYSAGAPATARAALITDGWTIDDGGPA